MLFIQNATERPVQGMTAEPQSLDKRPRMLYLHSVARDLSEREVVSYLSVLEW